MADTNRDVVNVGMIKSEFLVREKSALQIEGDDEEVPDKRAKFEGDDTFEYALLKKNKNKKYYKNARFRGRERNSTCENLCKTLIDVPVNAPMPVCESLRCRYLHDVKKFLQSKPPDIAEECHVFKLKGHCPKGISCRFGSCHTTESGRNVVNETTKAHYEQTGPKTLSFFTRELENDLKKRMYNFKKSEDVLEALPKLKPSPPLVPFTPYNASTWGPDEIDFTEDVDVSSLPPIVEPSGLDEERIGPCPDDDLFRLHLAEKKKIDWNDKLYLAPLTNFGNLPFRRVCKEFGADVTCSEMVVATSILQSQPFEWLLTKRHESEDVFGVQVFGNNPYTLTRCAQLLEEKTNADFIDVAMNSPGETLGRLKESNPIRREKGLETILRCVSRVSRLPITVSTRLGDYSDDKIADKFLPNYKSCQISLVTVQGRNKETREPDWNYVSSLSRRLRPVNVYGISDVLSNREYYQIKENYPDVAGALIGRGALVKPWLFSEIKEQRDWDISSRERFDILKKFVNYGLEHWGSDTKGVELTRRFLVDWLSFHCRYIPLGLLEQRPQKINDKYPKYVGRDDLETLLGSQNASDWIKISVMLLGPCSENHQFVPRIKSNFWPVDS